MLTCRQATQLLSFICWHAVHVVVMENKSKHSVNLPKSLKILMRVSR